MSAVLLLPVAFALLGAPLYGLLPAKWRPCFLLAISLGFYASFNWRFLFLLLAVLLVAFWGAQAVVRWRNAPWVLTAVNLAVLTPLIFYKYLLAWFDALRAAIVPTSSLDFGGYGEVLIPVGLSFFTFQCLGYLIEVGRGYYPPTRSFVRFALFGSFFPLLLSGPIERWQRLSGPLDEAKRPTADMVLGGLVLMAWGIVLKSVVGDPIGAYVDAVYEYPAQQASATAIVGIVGFTLQLFADFAGYSLLALGAAKLFGIDVIENFRQPFFAASIADFWQRWHISLTRWIGDFIYRPLALRLIKVKALPRSAKEIVTLLVTWLTMGLWHGANWTFVIFGLSQATLIYGHARMNRGRRPVRSRLRAVLGWAATMAVVVVTFGLIRAKSVGDYVDLLTSAASFRPGLLSFPDWEKALFGLAVMLAVEAWRRFWPERRVTGVAARTAALGVLLLTALLYGYEQSKAFIYFRF
jgi:D-alanyl-lipoteichoic acid acyltransferase DltB (MBOAT superfamily)